MCVAPNQAKWPGPKAIPFMPGHRPLNGGEIKRPDHLMRECIKWSNRLGGVVSNPVGGSDKYSHGECAQGNLGVPARPPKTF